jgi:ribosomal large subunit pseudouridine synthase E (EC 5.4.99.-)
MSEIVLLNKPFNCLSQFSDKEGRVTLAEVFQGNSPGKDFYPAGRLDFDSEGLLLLTNSGELQHRISSPALKMAKTYWVQVEGAPDPKAIKALQTGITLKDGKTKPAKVKLIPPPKLWHRNPPIRSRDSIPTHWIELTIHEGKNRQVRRMTAAVGYPTLRLVRVAIGNWTLGDLQPGESRTETLHLPKNSARQGNKAPRQRRNQKTSPQ